MISSKEIEGREYEIVTPVSSECIRFTPGKRSGRDKRKRDTISFSRSKFFR
jgi:hypothetical protein